MLLSQNNSEFRQLDFLKMMARMTTINYTGGRMPDTFKIFTSTGLYILKADKSEFEFIPN